MHPSGGRANGRRDVFQESDDVVVCPLFDLGDFGNGEARLLPDFDRVFLRNLAQLGHRGIADQAGEHALITASGKLRYADAKEDNGPDGLPRSFKDLLRILPFNEAGRGALIGRIGDKDTAQPFIIGARRDVVAPVSGQLSVGINQTTDDTGDGTYAVLVEVYTPEGGSARVVAASHALAGRLDQAHKAMARLREIDPTLRVSDLRHMFTFRRPEDLARFEEGLRKAGLPE